MTERVDGATGRILVEVDEDLWELVPFFLENRQEEIQTISNALRTGNFVLIARLGHSMRGAGASYGFTSITDIGAEIETAAKKEDREGVRRAVGDLQSYLARVQPVSLAADGAYPTSGSQ